MSDGETPEAAVRNLQDAIAAWIEEARAIGGTFRHRVHVSQSLKHRSGCSPCAAAAATSARTSKALLDAVRLCRRECVTGITAAPMPGPHYTAIRKLMAAMDGINGRFGRGSSLAIGISRGWSARQNRLSPRYTTRADEMMEATAW
jgi:hypothetical protein